MASKFYPWFVPDALVRDASGNGFILHFVLLRTECAQPVGRLSVEGNGFTVNGQGVRYQPGAS